MHTNRLILTTLVTMAVTAASIVRFEVSLALDINDSSKISCVSDNCPIHPSFDQALRGTDVWRLVHSTERVLASQASWFQGIDDQAGMARFHGSHGSTSLGGLSLQSLRIKLQI